MRRGLSVVVAVILLLGALLQCAAAAVKNPRSRAALVHNPYQEEALKDQVEEEAPLDAPPLDGYYLDDNDDYDDDDSGSHYDDDDGDDGYDDDGYDDDDDDDDGDGDDDGGGDDDDDDDVEDDDDDDDDDVEEDEAAVVGGGVNATTNHDRDEQLMRLAKFARVARFALRGPFVLVAQVIATMPALIFVRRFFQETGLAGLFRSHMGEQPGVSEDFFELLVKPPGVGWDDVVGAEEAVRELRAIVETFANPEVAVAARRSGAKVPRNVLLTGPPGTGKSLLARAAARESEAPILLVSASELVKGKYAGVGVERVKQLFTRARQEAAKSPSKIALIFIDEIDSCARARGEDGSAVSADHDNTLNQLLVELDGFSSSYEQEGRVVVLAATNRERLLDPALLRAGRFDVTVPMGAPDTLEREALFRYYIKKQRQAAGAAELEFDVLFSGGDFHKNVSVLARLHPRNTTANSTHGRFEVLKPRGGTLGFTLRRRSLTLTDSPEDVATCLLGDEQKASLSNRVDSYKVVHRGARERDVSDTLAAELARLTPGAVGADVAAAVNDAALETARRGAHIASRTDLLNAVDRMLLGTPRLRAPQMGVQRRVAFHEAGHTLASFRLGRPAIRVGLSSRSGGSAGATIIGDSDNEEDSVLPNRAALKNRLIFVLGGRAAEIAIFGDDSSGAADDLEKAASLARTMVTHLGMSGLGASGAVVTADKMHDEQAKLLDEAADSALTMMRDNELPLRDLARALLAEKTLDHDRIAQIIGKPSTIESAPREESPPPLEQEEAGEEETKIRTTQKGHWRHDKPSSTGNTTAPPPPELLLLDGGGRRADLEKEERHDYYCWHPNHPLRRRINSLLRPRITNHHSGNDDDDDDAS